jgi:hypothetical protein
MDTDLFIYFSAGADDPDSIPFCIGVYIYGAGFWVGMEIVEIDQNHAILLVHLRALVKVHG